MASWEPGPEVHISGWTVAGVLFIAACCFTAGLFLYFYGL